MCISLSLSRERGMYVCSTKLISLVQPKTNLHFFVDNPFDFSDLFAVNFPLQDPAYGQSYSGT